MKSNAVVWRVHETETQTETSDFKDRKSKLRSISGSKTQTSLVHHMRWDNQTSRNQLEHSPTVSWPIKLFHWPWPSPVLWSSEAVWVLVRSWCLVLGGLGVVELVLMEAGMSWVPVDVVVPSADRVRQCWTWVFISGIKTEGSFWRSSRSSDYFQRAALPIL